MKTAEKINLAISIILILLTGLITGYTMGYVHAKQNSFPDIRKVEDQNPGITTIKFLKLENGLLKGEVGGQKARIAYEANANTIRDLKPGESFEIPIYQVSLGQFYTVRNLPKGVQFIASKSGKYYYSVLDPRAFKITPKNRIYFKLESEAEKRGYLSPK